MSELKIKNRDWAVVLDGRKALLLQNHGDELYPDLVVREVRDHVDQPNHELHTDRPGKVHQSAASSHSAVEQTDRHDAAERAFVEQVSARLAELVSADKDCRIVVVAPPRALGMIRKAYSPAVRAALSAELDHDWIHLPVHDIESRLIGLSRPKARGDAA
jgi:protein required for attachment to host cells